MKIYNYIWYRENINKNLLKMYRLVKIKLFNIKYNL